MTVALRDVRLTPAVDRRFAALFGLSLLLHGAIAAFFAWQRPATPPALPPIVASLRLIVPVSTPTVSPAPAAPAAALPPKAWQKAARTERPAPRDVLTAGPANATRVVPAASSEAPPTAPAVVAVTKPAAEPPALAAAPVAVAPAVVARPAGEALDRYRQRLAALFASQHEYPRVAAMRGWEGEVRLRLQVARKGNLLGVVLDHSSGFEVLDRHALAMLEGYGSLPPLPETLEVNEISVVVPISYKLRKTT